MLAVAAVLLNVDVSKISRPATTLTALLVVFPVANVLAASFTSCPAFNVSAPVVELTGPDASTTVISLVPPLADKVTVPAPLAETGLLIVIDPTLSSEMLPPPDVVSPLADVVPPARPVPVRAVMLTAELVAFDIKMPPLVVVLATRFPRPVVFSALPNEPIPVPEIRSSVVFVSANISVPTALVIVPVPERSVSCPADNATLVVPFLNEIFRVASNVRSCATPPDVSDTGVPVLSKVMSPLPPLVPLVFTSTFAVLSCAFIEPSVNVVVVIVLLLLVKE